MSQKPIKLSHSKRKQVIRENIGKIDYNKIAKICGVDRRTIYRDIEKMKEKGEWFNWVEERYLETLASPNVADKQRLISLGILYGKQFTEKHQVETKGDINIIIKKWSIDDGDTDNP